MAGARRWTYERRLRRGRRGPGRRRRRSGVFSAAVEPGPLRTPLTLGGYVRRQADALRRGELGSLPIIVGLIVIAIVFGNKSDTFFTHRNFTNLLLQMAAVATMAIGTVFVLLIGEIDLSVSYVSAVGGVMMVLLLRPGASDWPWWASIGVALAITTGIGFLHAIIITKAGVPSFVVTLAGILIWSGVVLVLTTQHSTSGTVRVQDRFVIGIANNFLSTTWGWIVAVIVAGVYASAAGPDLRGPVALAVGRQALGGRSPIQLVGLAAVTFTAVWYANQDRGVPRSP